MAIVINIRLRGKARETARSLVNSLSAADAQWLENAICFETDVPDIILADWLEDHGFPRHCARWFWSTRPIII